MADIPVTLICLGIFIEILLFLFRRASAPSLFVTILFSTICILYMSLILIPTVATFKNRPVLTKCQIDKFILADTPTDIGDDKYYCPTVLISYVKQGTTYHDTIMENCLKNKDDQMKQFQKSTLKLGSTIDCYSNPALESGNSRFIEFTPLAWDLFLIALCILGYVNYRYRHPSPMPNLSLFNTALYNPAKKLVLLYIKYKYPDTPSENMSKLLSSTPEEWQAAIKAAQASSQVPDKPPAQTKTTGQTVLILLFTVLAFGGTTFFFIKTEWRANHDFIKTSCTILNKTMDTSVDNEHRMYLPKFEVKYKAQNADFSQWITTRRLSGKTSFSWGANRTFNYYVINEQYDCWYDPLSPTTVVLERGYSILTYLLSFATLILIWGLIAGAVEYMRNK